MDTTGKTKHITCRIKESLLEQIDQRMKQSPSEENRSDFINKALERALGNQQQSSNEFANMAKRVEALNTKTTEQKVSDLEIKLQIIYEEIQRQNEILVMTHRRATFAANFSLNGLNKVLGSTEFTDREAPKLIEITTKEIKDSGLQLSRK